MTRNRPEVAFDFNEVIEFGQRCVADGLINISIQDRERLNWHWFFSDGRLGAEASLARLEK